MVTLIYPYSRDISASLHVNANKREWPRINKKYNAKSLSLSKKRGKGDFPRLVNSIMPIFFLVKLNGPPLEKVTGFQLKACWNDDVRCGSLSNGILANFLYSPFALICVYLRSLAFSFSFNVLSFINGDHAE